MARYKQYNYDQLKLLPISFSRQILPGTFEYTLSHIIDHELNLSRFDARIFARRLGNRFVVVGNARIELIGVRQQILDAAFSVTG